MVKQATGWLLACSTKTVQHDLPLRIHVYTWRQLCKHIGTRDTVLNCLKTMNEITQPCKLVQLMSQENRA